MSLFNFRNKTIQNRKFDYQPMYYDERKEKLENRKAKYQRMESGEMSDSERLDSLREDMRGEWGRAEYRQSQRSRSNIRIFVLVALIFALGYFILNGVDEVDTIVNKLW